MFFWGGGRGDWLLFGKHHFLWDALQYSQAKIISFPSKYYFRVNMICRQKWNFRRICSFQANILFGQSFFKSREIWFVGKHSFDEICFSPAKIFASGEYYFRSKLVCWVDLVVGKEWNISYHQATSILPGKVFKIDTLWTKNKYYQFKNPQSTCCFEG